MVVARGKGGQGGGEAHRGSMGPERDLTLGHGHAMHYVHGALLS